MGTEFTNEELALKIQAGEREYLEVLWEQIKKFVMKLAYRYNWICERWHFVDVEDFIQCGYFAMAYAVEHYNPKKGMKFLSYFSFWYKSQIYIAVAGRKVRELPPPTRSLNETVDGEENQAELIDLIPDFRAELEELIVNEEVRETVRKEINKLKEIEARIIYLTYFQNMTTKEASYELNISEMDATLHKRRAHNKLGITKEINQLYDAHFA